MNDRLIIIGAGGHGKVVADNALKNGYAHVCFADDRATGQCMGLPIIGTTSDLDALNDGHTDFVIGIGNNEIRKRIAEEHNLPWATLIHPSVQIAVNASVGKGTVVMAGAVINADATVGNHCIINTGAIVEHDNRVHDYVHISPRAALGGTVCVGELTHVGIGATVRNNITITEKCLVGAGAVVVKNIEKSGVYVGVPAKEIV